MNREFLFKGKTTEKENGEFNNVWVEGDLVLSKGKYYIHPRGDRISVTGESGGDVDKHEVIPETICQYTCFKDRNRRKVFENSIVRVVGEDDYFVTKWDNSGARFVLEKPNRVMSFDCHLLSKAEVIGNVFDNQVYLQAE